VLELNSEENIKWFFFHCEMAYEKVFDPIMIWSRHS
jgi:hypothetical protein